MKNLNSWQKFYNSIRAGIKIPCADLRSGTKLSFRKRMRMWQKGFLSEKYYYYNLEHNDLNLYLSDCDRAKTRFINEPYADILHNKLIFESVLSKHVRVPVNHGLIMKGRVILLAENNIPDIADRDTICDLINFFCNKNGKVVLKPVKGAFGRGVMIVSYIDGVRYLVNQVEYSKEALQSKLEKLDNYLLTEFIKQGEHPNKIYPYATNTLRVVTINASEANMPFIAAVARRIGTDKSAPMDNNAQGGMTANVDIDSGEMGPAAGLTKKGLIWHSSHPDSGAKIEGEIIPGWDNIKDEIIRVAVKLAYLKYVGWDIVESEQGIVFIEGNNQPNFRVVQIHRPLLADPKVKDFFRKHKVIN